MGGACSGGTGKQDVSHEGSPPKQDTFLTFVPLPPEHAVKGPCVVDAVDKGTKIEFLTDVEGNWDYFLRWVSMCESLEWVGDDRGAFGPGQLRLRDDCIFVFGGDAPDKGPGDIRFVRTLLDLKARYEQRVFIVLGNRDLNKLRFGAELEPGAEPFFPLPWADSDDLQSWLRGNTQFSGDPPQVQTLRWMLHFMGCQNTTMDTRRHELALLNPGVPITGMDVVESYRDSVDPQGPSPWMLRLLQAGHLMVVLGDNLFVHGGVHEKVLGEVPGRGKVEGGLREWVTELNAWKEAQLREFVGAPLWQPSREGRKRSAEALILYGTPGFPNGATVVYHNPFMNGNPQPFAEEVEAYLERNGIRRVFSGHQPHGQSPTVVRHPCTGILKVTCDTSYSCPRADKLFNPANMRGTVASVVRVEAGLLVVKGVLADGSAHGFTLDADEENDELPHALVGRQLTDGSWVKTVLADVPQHVQVVFSKGFSLESSDMHMGKACLKLKNEFRVASLQTPLARIEAEWLQAPTVLITPEYNPEGVDEAMCTPDLASQAQAHKFLFKAQEFHSAQTFIFNIGGVVTNLLCKSLSATGVLQNSSDIGPERRVAERINKLIAQGKRVLFISNNSNECRKSAAKSLLEMNIHLPAHSAFKHVLNSSYTCAWFLKNAGIKKPFILCSDQGILEELHEIGIRKYVATVEYKTNKVKEKYLEAATKENVVKLVGEHPDVDAVVVGWDTRLTTLKIAVASAYLNWTQRGTGKRIPLVACSTDVGGSLGTSPAEFCSGRGFALQPTTTPGNGLMARIVRSTADQKLSDNFIDVGEPSVVMLEALTRPEAEDGLGVDPKTAVLIGDSLATDIAMANYGGMKSLLVFSGATSPEDLQGIPAAQEPTWTLGSFADA